MHFTPITLEVKPLYLFKGADVPEDKFSPQPCQKWLSKSTGLVCDWMEVRGPNIALCLARDSGDIGYVTTTVTIMGKNYEPVETIKPGDQWTQDATGARYTFKCWRSGRAVLEDGSGKEFVTLLSNLKEDFTRAGDTKWRDPPVGSEFTRISTGTRYRFKGREGGMLRLDEAGTACFLLVTVAELVNQFRPEEPKMTESEFTEQDEKELLSAEVAGHLCWEVSEETCRALEKMTLAELRVLAREVEAAAAAIRAPLQTRVMELRQAARGKQ